MKTETVIQRPTIYHKFDVAERFLQHLKFSIRTAGRVEGYTVGQPEDVCFLVDVFRAGLNAMYNSAFQK